MRLAHVTRTFHFAECVSSIQVSTLEPRSGSQRLDARPLTMTVDEGTLSSIKWCTPPLVGIKQRFSSHAGPWGEISRAAAMIGNGNGSGSTRQASRDRRMPTSERLLQAAVDHASGGL